MSDVKDLLERAVGWYEPSSQGTDALERRAASRRRRARIAAGVVALVIFVASTSLVWNAFRSPSVVPASTVRGFFFPTVSKASNFYMQALTHRTLKAEHGCLFLFPDLRSDVKTRILPIWPQQAHLERSAGGLTVFFGDQPYGATGDTISLGGGLLSNVARVESMIGTSIPKRCQADGYWLAAPPEASSSPSNSSSASQPSG